ncbi:DUF4150 domain-containing protein [Acidovorax cavernicola]|uniref:DUF4150 domain-containing protein n=1 Tax=Acidovorax cavernicola TaxID=1675792 RepID=A0A9X8CZM7_9BURK|nr:DUF4150 domain-containing protein [Acidovorax cavernicola]RIX74287.1 DUF4150 domain-containing protein [Acidovorax cavernicola]
MQGNCQLGGMDLGIVDVCKTPAPTPFVNVGLGFMARPNVRRTHLTMMPAHNMGTTITKTLGDQPGVLGGIISQTFMDQSRHIFGAPKVVIEGMLATRLTSPTLQNRCNIIGLRLGPSQLTTLMF